MYYTSDHRQATLENLTDAAMTSYLQIKDANLQVY